MELIKSPRKINQRILKLKTQNKKIGFVPTMGFLHQGHLSLIKKAKRENDSVVVSIFINPAQFGPGEDLKNYPRSLKRDIKLAENSGADIVFAPKTSSMYKRNFQTSVYPGRLAAGLCGLRRPGHFPGVCTIVVKLFNLVRPETAYFGQKDYQQAMIIRKMADDLNFDIRIKILPTVRERDGLAMSSRNRYLSKAGRQQAALVYSALKEARAAFREGCRNSSVLKKIIKKTICRQKCVKIEYVEILDAETLNDVKCIERKALAAVAVKVDDARLIDNLILRP